MKRIKLALILIALSASAMSTYAWADHGHHRGRVGVFIGAPALWPWYYPGPYYSPYYYPPYFYPQVMTVPSAPPVYIEQEEAQDVPSQPSGYWYYCSEPQGYYPHVKECPAGWQKVAPQPPPNLNRDQSP